MAMPCRHSRIGDVSRAGATFCAALCVGGACETERTVDDVRVAVSQAGGLVQGQQSLVDRPDAAGSVLSGRERGDASAIERVVEILVPNGAAPVLAPQRLASDSQRATLPVNVAIGGCYAFVAVAPEGDDVDLRVVDPGGSTVADDRSPDSFPALPSVCFNASGTHVLELTVARGRVDAWVAVYALDGVTADAARRLGASASAHAPGAVSHGPVAADVFAAPATISVPVAVPPGGCIAATAVGDAGVRDIDLVWVTGTGDPEWRDLGVDATPYAGPVCGAGASWRLDLRVYEGAGRVWWQLFEVPATD